MNDEYRKSLRDFMARRGRPVEISENDRTRYPDFPGLWVSTYGWVDGEAQEHAQSCSWVVDAGVSLTEVSYSEFTDTDSDNKETVGINVEPAGTSDVRCTCGQYRGVTLRWQGSLMEAVQEIFGTPGPGRIVL